MTCKHQWQGRADKVVCLLCGKELSINEYQKLLKPKQTKKKKEANAK